MMQLPQVVLALALRAAGRRAGHRLRPDADGAGRQPAGLRHCAGRRRAHDWRTAGRASRRFNRRPVFAPLALAAGAGPGVPGGRGASRSSAARRAAPPLPGSAATSREADCHRYAAHNFYGEIKRYFRWLGGAPAAARVRKPSRFEGALK